MLGVLLVGLWSVPGWTAGGEQLIPKGQKQKPTQGELVGLVAALDDDGLETKELALRQLAKFDGSVLRGTLKQPEVVAKKAFDILEDEKNNSSLRVSAAAALANLSDVSKPYVKDIRKFLRNEKTVMFLREQLISSIGNLGDLGKPYAQEIGNLIKDEKNDPYIRSSAISALESFGDAGKPYAQDIRDFLRDEEIEVSAKSSAISALGSFGDTSKPYANDMRDFIKNDKVDASTRLKTFAILANLGDGNKSYGNAVRDFIKNDQVDASTRANAVSELISLGDLAKPYVGDIQNFLKDEKIDDSTRANLVSSLLVIGDLAKPYVNDIRNFLKNERVDTSIRVRAVSILGSLDDTTLRNLGDATKIYTKEVHDLFKDEKIDISTRINLIPALENLEDVAKSYIKDIINFLKDEKNPDYVRENAASVLGSFGDAAKPYAQDICDFLKDEKVKASVRGSAAAALGNLGDVAKPHMKQWAVLLGDLFVGSARNAPLQQTSQEMVAAIVKLGGLNLTDSLPIVNGIYRNTPALQTGRFLAKATTQGDKDTVTLLNWVGKPKNTPKKLTHDEAKNTLTIFQTAWNASADLPELRTDLATQIREVTNNRYITWQADDIPLLTGLVTALKIGGYTSADIDSAIRSISAYKWVSTVVQTFLIHIAFWICLIFFYPKFPQIQAIFFWNPWVRNIAGLGYVSFLLTWIPFLRDRLLAPFRASLLADANLLNEDPNAHYFSSSQVCPRNSKELQPLPKFQGQLIIEGESGLGKTMYLRQIVQTTKRNTVYLTAQRCENGVLEAIQDKLEGNAKDPNFLQSLIYSSALDICIDGLNEVSPDTRAKVTQFLEHNFQGNFLLTTQPLNGWNPPKTAKIYELQPLKPDQIREFLHSRVDTLPVASPVTGLEYIAACDKVLNQYLVTAKDTPINEDKKIRRVFSNPMDLTLIAHTIAAKEILDPFRLQERDYKRMSGRYATRFNQAFPLKQFAEAVYNMRLSDQDSIPIKDFSDELEIMEEAKMVVRRISREVTEDDTPTARILWNFRHDKILEYFLAQLFLGQTDEVANLSEKHLGDPRFSGVYFLLADLMPFNEAQDLREILLQYGADTQDNTVSNIFIQLLRTRNPD